MFETRNLSLLENLSKSSRSSGDPQYPQAIHQSKESRGHHPTASRGHAPRILAAGSAERGVVSK